MKRRDFSISLVTAGLGLGSTGLVLAQGAAVEGTHYVKLSRPAPVSLPSPDKKVEVVEFFWYECGHCNVFEPMLEAWAGKLAPDVYFRQVPVGFSARHQLAQKLFYALEEMGLLETLHRRIYAAVHIQGRRLTSEKEIVAVVTANGVDETKFLESFRSFSVNTKASKARQLSDAYKIDGTPAIGIQGRFYTSASLAGSHERALAVADQLIERSRKAA